MESENDSRNPYEAKVLSEYDSTNFDPRNSHAVYPSAILLMGYLGTTLSGAGFGLVAGPIGFVVGGILAGLFGIVPYFLVGLWASIYRNPTLACEISAGAGAITGGISMFCFSGFHFSLLMAVTAAIGAIGGLFGGLLGAFVSGEPTRWNQLKTDHESV